MSNISIKKDFADGDILPASDLNNNFKVIEAGINANDEQLEQVIENAILRLDAELIAITADRGWDWNGGERVTFFKGTTNQVNSQAIKNGQLLYNVDTGETAVDSGNERINTGSGNVVAITTEEPENPATKLWIDPTVCLQNVGTEVVNSMTGNQTTMAPSVASIKSFIVESGSNANGNYIKFYDGTMVCYGQQEITSKDGYKDVILPTNFINNNYSISITNGYYYSTEIFWSYADQMTSQFRIYSRLKNGDIPSIVTACYYITIGRWK